MDVVLKNLRKFDSNYYKGIEINEFDEEHKYLVKFFGRDVWFDSTLVGEKRSDKLDGLSSEDKIKFIVNDYLNSARIDYFTGIIKGKSIYGNMFFVSNGTRYLELNIKNIELGELIDNIYSKYCNDRYDFCYKDNGIRTYMIDTADFSSYEIIDGKLPYDNADNKRIMKLILKTDNKGVINSECEFIRQFIIDKFFGYNEEIRIERVYESKYLRKGILLRCGDVELYVPYYRYLLWIIDMVNEYNEELKKTHNNIKRRQLKMEGF